MTNVFKWFTLEVEYFIEDLQWQISRIFQMVGVNLLFGKICARNCMKKKEIEPTHLDSAITYEVNSVYSVTS